MVSVAFLVAACGGVDGSDALPSVSQIATPTVAQPVSTPTSEPKATPPPAPVATTAPGITAPHVDLATLTIPVCLTDPSNIGFGTVPRSPNGGSSDPTGGTSAEADVLDALSPVVSWAGHFTAIFDDSWEVAESERDFARVLLEESRRLWLACHAVAAVTPSLTSEHPFLVSFKSLLADRQKWLTGRLETLRVAPVNIRDDDDRRSLDSMALLNKRNELHQLAVDAGVEHLPEPPSSTLPNPLLELSVEIPADWVLVRNRVDIVVAAPPDLQGEGVSGLGVPGWNFGTALRIRRLRHEAPWLLSDTATLMYSLLGRFGEQASDELTQLTGQETIVRTYESPENEWITTVAATVRDLHTYLFELGCPADDRDSCQNLLQQILVGVQFTDE